MGVFDKIKNALFEVEYVEVDEPSKPEKKKKNMNSMKINLLLKRLFCRERKRKRLKSLKKKS